MLNSFPPRKITKMMVRDENNCDMIRITPYNWKATY